VGTGPKLRGEQAPARREASPDEFKAMAHPLRLRILRSCLHEALTNKEIADRLDQDPATTLHHVRLLVRTGFLEAGETRTGARGSREKPYRATGKSWVLSVTDPSHTIRSEPSSTPSAPRSPTPWPPTPSTSCTTPASACA
jgi:DNA-binding transcriptional ArsR family regulator